MFRSDPNDRCAGPKFLEAGLRVNGPCLAYLCSGSFEGGSSEQLVGSFLPGTLSGLWLDIGGGILFIGLFLRRGICGGFGHIYLLCVLEAAAPANRCVPGGRSQLERAPTTRCPPPRVFACRGFGLRLRV